MLDARVFDLDGHIEMARMDDEVTYRDDWQSDPVLVAENAAARAAARPDTDLYREDLAEYVADQYDATGGDGHPDPQAWFNAALDDATAWHHFGDGVFEGLRWSLWAHIDFGHGALCHVRDESTGETLVYVTAVI